MRDPSLPANLFARMVTKNGIDPAKGLGWGTFLAGGIGNSKCGSDQPNPATHDRTPPSTRQPTCFPASHQGITPASTWVIAVTICSSVNLERFIASSSLPK